MKFSANWLREIVNPEVSNQQLVEQLTMAGLEVESIAPACIDFSGVFTAQIVKVEQHPDADKLKIKIIKLTKEMRYITNLIRKDFFLNMELLSVTLNW